MHGGVDYETSHAKLRPQRVDVKVKAKARKLMRPRICDKLELIRWLHFD